VANQIYNRFKAAGKSLNKGDIAIVAAAEFHDYQVRSSYLPLSLGLTRTTAWLVCTNTRCGYMPRIAHFYYYLRTLVGAGLKDSVSSHWLSPCAYP
jgi:hypothetical protein